ncbi:hypothetical protein [Membranihabitans maritimus]|uniref:hypothetical protein n=1 Tax=Membranihabitans maritimus TaxID=2904244 RepID=UPI001F16FED6|nr:hypothetical protein [Membranihabitans maritimus]
MKKIAIIIYVLLCVVVFVSCTEDRNIEPRQLLVDRYYPIESGMERLFKVDSITYDFNGEVGEIVIDTTQLFLKQIIKEESSINGIDWYVIEELTADSEESEYEFKRLVLERKNEGRLQKKEGNLTFIPLSSSLELYDEWQGTALFDKSAVEIFVEGEIIKPYENWNYILVEDNGTLEVEGTVYNEVIQINQHDTSTLESMDMNGNPLLFPPEKQLFYELANEWYAPDKGLVMKEEYNLTSICASSSVNEFQMFCDTTTIFQNAERGYIYRQKLISIE